jgi:NitT/TauT family transport system substrate-binding protein
MNAYSSNDGMGLTGMGLKGMGLSRRTILKSFAAAPLLMVPALAGCADTTSSSTTKESKDPLIVGQISNSIAFFPIFVAEKKGYFTTNGVTLGDRPRLGTGAKIAAALKSGSIDLGGGVLTDAFNLYGVDKSTKLVTGLVTEYYVDIVVGSNYSGPSASASVNDKITSLVGKKIGMTGPGSGTEALLTYLFKRIGKDASKDATLVNLGSVATAAIGALSAGQVDALSFFQPIGQLVEAAGKGSIYISPARGDIDTMKGQLHGVVFSTQSLITNKKTQVAGFYKSIDQALKEIHANPDETKSLLGEYLNQTSMATLDGLMKILPIEMPKTAAMTKKSYDIAVKFHVESGLVKSAPNFDTIVPSTSRA